MGALGSKETIHLLNEAYFCHPKGVKVTGLVKPAVAATDDKYTFAFIVRTVTDRAIVNLPALTGISR